MALHEQAVGGSDEWYTPPYIFEAMGAQFDMDVASPGCEVTPWIPAAEFIRQGVVVPWEGFIWMNPPFGARNGLVPWLERFFDHGNGVALVPDRTSAPWWQDFAPKADAILFVRSKIRFIGSNGLPGNSPAQGTTLLAAGPRGVTALRSASAAGLGFLLQSLSTPSEQQEGVHSQSLPSPASRSPRHSFDGGGDA